MVNHSKSPSGVLFNTKESRFLKQNPSQPEGVLSDMSHRLLVGSGELLPPQKLAN